MTIYKKDKPHKINTHFLTKIYPTLKEPIIQKEKLLYLIERNNSNQVKL